MTSSRSHLGRYAPGYDELGLGRSASFWLRLTFGLIALQTLLVCTTFVDYGITHDEKWNSTYGYHVIHWYLSGFQDTAALTYWTLPYEGAFFNVLARVAANLLPLDDYETGHLLGGLFCVVGTLYTARLAGFLGGARAGFLAALFLVTVPRFYGHGFANARDIPTAVLVVATLDGLVRLLPHLPRPPLRRIVAVGVPLGLSMGVRVGSLLLLALTALTLLSWLVAEHLQPQDGRTPLGEDLRGLARTFAIVVALAWGCMLPWWPKALVDPTWPFESFASAIQGIGHDVPAFFRGETLSNQDLPWGHALTWFGLVLPEHLLLALGVAAVAALGWLGQSGARPVGESASALLPLAIPLVAVGLPLGYVSLQGAIGNDGIRHLLFVLPPLCVLGALGLEQALGDIELPTLRTLFLVLALSPTAVAVADMVWLHPFQYVHFNRTVAGGLPGAHGRYDIEYWGASLSEGVEWVVEHYDRADQGRPLRVASNSYSESIAHHLPSGRFEYLGGFEDGLSADVDAPFPDLYLSTVRRGAPPRLSGRVVHTVERMGVPLAYVIEVELP